MPARQEPHGPGRNTSDVDDFLESTIARRVKAEEALHRGDVAPRIEMWSTHDPVTLFGAWGPCKSGWDEASRTFHWMASRFSDLRSYELELVAAGASGDLAYTVGYERSRHLSTEGRPCPTRSA